MKPTQTELNFKLIPKNGKYNYWIATDENGKHWFNVIQIDQQKPTSGYSDSNYICKMKGVENIFPEFIKNNPPQGEENKKLQAGWRQMFGTPVSYYPYINIEYNKNIIAVIDMDRMEMQRISRETTEKFANHIINACNNFDRLTEENKQLFKMVRDLKFVVNKLSQDDLTQFERDGFAQWEGEAHELLLKINPNYFKNANE